MPKFPRRRDSDYIRFPPYYVFKSQPGQPTRSDLIALAWRVSLYIGAPAVTVVAVIFLIRQFILNA